jgi:hypothetical protein
MSYHDKSSRHIGVPFGYTVRYDFNSDLMADLVHLEPGDSLAAYRGYGDTLVAVERDGWPDPHGCQMAREQIDQTGRVAFDCSAYPGTGATLIQRLQSKGAVYAV